MNGTGVTLNRRTADFGTDGMRSLDDLLRRRLGVGNPADLNEMLTALQRKYPSQAAASQAESMGLPAIASAVPANVPVSSSTYGDAQYDDTASQLRIDFASVVDAPSSRMFNVELSGWREYLLNELDTGVASARLAQDAAERDRALLAIRRLNEYGWLARVVGIFMGEQYWDFRRLATSLDNSADILRVKIGETLYQVGVAYNGVLLQVPVNDLRQRGQALIDALDGLVGGGEEVFDDWGERFTSYQALFGALPAELKGYLRREMVAQLVDSLVSGVSSGGADRLRQLAATIPLELARLWRVWEAANKIMARHDLASSALSIFANALELFNTAFEQERTGALFIDLALPAPIGAMKMSSDDIVRRTRLRRLIDLRAAYAFELEARIVFQERTLGRQERLLRNDYRLFLLHLAVDAIASANDRP